PTTGSGPAGGRSAFPRMTLKRSPGVCDAANPVGTEEREAEVGGGEGSPRWPCGTVLQPDDEVLDDVREVVRPHRRSRADLVRDPERGGREAPEVDVAAGQDDPRRGGLAPPLLTGAEVQVVSDPAHQARVPRQGA